MSTAGVRDIGVDDLLATSRIVVCCGAGGVGKTTTAAALALRAAEHGRKVCVLTIDPARRLAQSMGLNELDNTPRPVTGIEAAGGGELHAMMLDMKRTFDEIVMAHSDPERAEQILSNPFYVSLSSSFAGTQEYMAMEKLGQLRSSGQWDLIVVDTPPSRSALDFLDAPQRLGRFLDGRMIRMLLAPAKAGGKAYLKVFSIGMNVLTNVLTRVLGGEALKDLSFFVASLEAMFGGFRERAERTYQLLKEPGTAFLVVAAPERDALREATYFVERLAGDRMPIAGLVLNRVHTSAAPGLSHERALAGAESLDESGESPLTAGVLRIHAERIAAAGHDARMTEQFHRAHPSVPVVAVAAQPTDVHDLEGLRVIATELANGPEATPPTAPVRTAGGRQRSGSAGRGRKAGAAPA